MIGVWIMIDCHLNVIDLYFELAYVSVSQVNKCKKLSDVVCSL